MYKEYRLKQIKVHTILQGVGTATAGGMNDVFKANGIIIGTSWSRSSNLTDLDPVDFDKLVLFSDSTIRHWTAGNGKNELWTSCTASNAGGEGTWLNTAFPP